MNQAVFTLLLLAWGASSQSNKTPPHVAPVHRSPFLHYMLPPLHTLQYQPYTSQYQVPYTAPAHTHPIVSPAHTYPIVSPANTYPIVSPSLYRDTRALCSLCSCATDYGCAYNCHKCPA